ncbi:hypothetical protein NPIL_449131 [Nephila pilipes]|uniref:Uncharacterized protein n=1 Tax=Nephila pilipes TaxID=299642 RepID=A0A8X6QZL5_NEPPI|nr:hypothetical protein NPIL_449131 [Nephila pilipes]
MRRSSNHFNLQIHDRSCCFASGWGSLQREMVKMILIRRHVPYPDCRNSKPWSVKGVREIFGGFPRKIALKSAA